MMGFVVSTGRSGTMWTARALTRCCGLDARHEFMRYDIGYSYGGVEVNGNLWNHVPLIRKQFPLAGVVHQVRDGRDVVRSIQSRKGKDWPFERSCERWAVRNRRMVGEVPASHRFYLEDLVADFGVFAEMARIVGADRTDPQSWQSIRSVKANAHPEWNLFPAYDKWSPEHRDTFWRICGEMMHELGYSR